MADEQKENEALTINDALNEYYKLKSNYEQNFHDKYIKSILRSKNKSKREKRLEYQKLPKPECINCKRNVGSIFTIKKNKELYFRQFIAKCGDLKDPCPFNIIIDYTQRSELNKELLDHDYDINTIKNKIIKDKNNVMFGYVDQQKAFEMFYGDTAELKDITEAAGYIIDINIQLNDNPVKKDLIKTYDDKLGVEFIKPFKEMIKDFDQTGNLRQVNNAVTLYTEELVPLAKTIRDLKYEVCYVDYVDSNNSDDVTEDTYFLIQKKNSLYNLEYTLYGNDEIKSFVKGIDDKSSKTRKNRTRKVRPTIILNEVLEGEEGKEGEDEDLDSSETNKEDVTNVTDKPPEIEFDIEEIVSEINPSYNPDGSITWLDSGNNINAKYQQIWDYLQPEYKAALATDQNWMKKTMDSFVEFDRLRGENKLPYGASRQYVHPDGLLLPPKKVGDFEYDYGNTFYNSLLNKGKTSGIWMTFLPKSPDGSYQQYLDGLASIIGNAVKFTKI
jgi:hypothetical protein